MAKIRARDKLALRYNKKQRVKEENSSKRSGTAGGVIALLLSVMILLWHPVHDEYYYIAAALSAFASILSLRDMIRKFNELSTRAVPDFFEKKEE